MSENKNFIVTLEEDPETKDLIMPFPTEILSQMGWVEGTDLWWEVKDNGSVLITEVKKEDLHLIDQISTITKE